MTKGGRGITKIFLGIFLILMLIAPSMSEMDFEFKCQGSNGATMSSYSRLSEPSLQDSGYARGLRAGSFNYLENGDINLVEKIAYKYGNGTPKANTSYIHKMDLDFAGEKGISEFYGKEYFKNNRAISAWKKIRYEDINEDYLNLGKRNLAKNINVIADLRMDTTPGNGYDLKYNATVKEGVIETYDASGWSNRTGSRRIDWEYNAMMYGDVSVTNNLRENAPLEAHGGDEEWLPCCSSGTQPAIEPIYSPWPTKAVVKMLEADVILPNKNCTGITRTCFNNGTCIDTPRPCPTECSSGSCPGYECIYTYDQGGQRGNENRYNGTTVSLRVEQHTYQRISDLQVFYNIVIKNVGDIKIKEVTVQDTLPANMVYVSSSYYSKEDKELGEPSKSSDGTILTWSIGDLIPDQSKTIQLTVAGNADAGKSKVIASGYASGTAVVTPAREAEKEFGPAG